MPLVPIDDMDVKSTIFESPITTKKSILCLNY